ncbi:MAG: MFS transporter [Candidatus Omnitrophica bacterium]|nr:MFS transporter [Candidatus Omnitrophota bacterium]
MSLETNPAIETVPVVSKAERYPPQVKYIIWNEVCERFSYYGMMGILENYLSNRMAMGADGATEVLHLFGTAVYFLPLLGGWLADRWLGRYWTILSISLFYCLGHGTLAMFEGSQGGLFVGLLLLAIGAGGIKPCVSAFVGDQFRTDQQHLLTKVYGWFYWAINLGAAAAFFIIPTVKIHSGYRWAFGIPGIAMAVATLAFWSGTKYYVRQPPSAREEKRTRFFPVLWYALLRLGRRKAGGKFLDVALERYSLEEVEAARAVVGILVIFASVPMFWALFNQVNSTWVVQGDLMRPLTLFGGQWQLNGETMQGSGAVLVMIWVPILTLGIYPLFERLGWRPTALRRMSAGMLFAAVAFVISGMLQSRLDGGQTLSILWQLVPYIVLEAGEVTLSATALEFAFDQAPKQLKSIIMSFWLMTIAGGHFLIAAFTGLNERFVHAKGASEFYFYAVLMLVVAGIFILCAMRYRAPSHQPSAISY